MKKKTTNLSKPKPKPQPHFLFYLIAGLSLIYGTATAYQMRWLCDDIFITFRYVQNWLAGNGIVYNIGEKVEGYTHFLWMCLIALFQFLGSKPEEIVKTLGVLSYAGTLLIFIIISYKSVLRENLFIPLTAVLLALNFDFKIWATSGLETSFFTFLISASLWSLFIWKASTEKKLIVSGLLLTLATMTRPDGIVFLVTSGAFVAMRSLIQRENWKQFLRTTLLFGSSFIVIYISYFIWKYFYYGDIFPNTYYAKSGGANYYSQGFIYIWVYLKSYLSSFVVLLGIVVLFLVLKQEKTWRNQLRTLFLQPFYAMLLLSLGYVFFYGIFFVARVGGDFMYARFLHPIIPLIYLVGELSIYKLFIANKKYIRIAMILLPLLVVYEKSRRDSLFIEDNGKRKPAFHLNGITDEYWYWTQIESMPVDPIKANEIVGKQLEYYFRGEQVGVLLRGQASLGYYANFPLCIENAGLTDSYIAHLPIENRGRPGHEKNAPVDYLLKRGVHFVFFRLPYDTASYRRVFFRTGGDYSRAEMFFYDTKLMNNLKARFPKEVIFTDFQKYLDEYLLTLKQMKKEQVAADYEKFRKFYFEHNSDSTREKQFISFLEKQ